MVPVAPVFAFTFDVRCISIMRSLHFKIFSASFVITFLSPGIATCIDMHIPFFIITDYGNRFIVGSSTVDLHSLAP